MEEQGLIDLSLIHAPSSNPALAYDFIRQVPTGERALLRSGTILPYWPYQTWLQTVVPQLNGLARALSTGGGDGIEVRSTTQHTIWNRAVPAPLYIWSRGPALDGPFLAVVGPRRPSTYAINQAERLVKLAARQMVVVSGLAYGIDMIALRAAVAAGGRVVAIVPFGVERVYPPAHRAELERWVKEGRATVVSEYLAIGYFGKLYFWWRNRLIAALADKLFIPEAAVRSGTRITAQYALEYNTELAVLPADIDREQALYSNRLISEGAIPITSREDWQQFCGIKLSSPVVDQQFICLVEAMRQGCLDPESILANLRISPAGLNRLLSEAELANLVSRQADGTYRLLSA